MGASEVHTPHLQTFEQMLGPWVKTKFERRNRHRRAIPVNKLWAQGQNKRTIYNIGKPNPTDRTQNCKS